MTQFTLSDFYNMEIMTREDGSKTPVVAYSEGHAIGLIGYAASEDLSDFEIREEAFTYWQQLTGQIEKYLK